MGLRPTLRMNVLSLPVSDSLDELSCHHVWHLELRQKPWTQTDEGYASAIGRFDTGFVLGCTESECQVGVGAPSDCRMTCANIMRSDVS